MIKKILKAAMLTVCVAVIPVTLGTNAEAKPKSLSKNVKVGDTVYFGKYEQDADTGNGAEKLVWRVLDKKGGKALIATECLVDIHQYHKKKEDVTWETSDIRGWLNKDWVKSAFSSLEKKKLQSTKVINKDNIQCGTDGGKDTADKVFLLSIEEAGKYFKSDDDRKARMTDYYKEKYRELLINGRKLSEKEADNNIKYLEEERDACHYYWLRSPGYVEDFAAFVSNDGSVYGSGDSVYFGIDYGIRPALWVKL